MVDIKAIEATLKAATPRPWKAVPFHDGTNWSIWPTKGGVVCAAVWTEADANLVANAPTYIDDLLARVRDLEGLVSPEGLESLAGSITVRDAGRDSETFRWFLEGVVAMRDAISDAAVLQRRQFTLEGENDGRH